MKQDMIVILDLGSTENTVLARAIRALGVYSEIYPHDITAAELTALPNVKGVIINGGGYHCVHMTDEDLKIFKDKGLTAVTNPGSNVKLASGIAPVRKMMEMGIPIAIGTDGPASNNCLDMFREMFLVTGLAKILEEDAAAVDADEVLHMAVS